MGHTMAHIYGLFSGRDGLVRYVGRTGGACEDRFRQHLRSPSPKLTRWFHREWSDGYPVEWAVLQTCDDDVSSIVERHWMGRFPGLLNDRMSLQIWVNGACATAARIPEIVAYMRRYKCNSGGFRGIRYDSHWDCFQVLIYNEWLFGDACDEMMPGWGGNMWFPDRTAALIARDRARKWRPHVKWPPDIEQSEYEEFSASVNFAPAL